MAGWEKDWIDEAEVIVHAEFDKSYGLLDLGWAKQASKSNVHVLNYFFSKSYIYCPLDHHFQISKHF